MKFSTKAIVCVFVSVIGVFACWAQARQLPEPARMMPRETVFMVKTDNAAQMWDSFTGTNIYQLWQDESVQRFVSHLSDTLFEQFRQDLDGFAADLLEDAVLPDGTVALALVVNEKAIEKSEPMFLGIVDFGENAQRLRQIIDDKMPELFDQGYSLDRRPFGDTEISVLKAPQGSRHEFGFSSEICYAFWGSNLFVSEDIELVQFGISQADGASDRSLADDGMYEPTMAAVSTGFAGTLDVFVNIASLMELFISEEFGVDEAEIRTTLSKLGLDNIPALAASFQYDQSPENLTARALLRVQGHKRGIMSMVEPVERSLDVPRFVPASAHSISIYNMDIPGAVNELASIMQSFSPMMAAWLYAPVLPPDEHTGRGPVMLQQDIISHFDTGIIGVEALNKPFDVNKQPTESFFAFAINNRSALEPSLAALHSQILGAHTDQPVRQLLGHTIYKLDFMGLPMFNMPAMQYQQGPDQMAEIPRMVFTLTDTHLLVGSETLIEQAIRTLADADNPSVHSRQWFQRAWQRLPASAGGASLADNQAMVEMLWWYMQAILDTEENLPGYSPFGHMFQEITEKIDFSLLPQFDDIKQYFDVTTSTITSRPDGLYMESKY